jgi:hypothetical protein
MKRLAIIALCCLTPCLAHAQDLDLSSVTGAATGAATSALSSLTGGMSGAVTGAVSDAAGMATGVLVTGQCVSTGLIASSSQLSLMSTSMSSAVESAQQAIVSAINSQTEAGQALQAAVSDRANGIAGNSLAAEITAQGQVKALDILASEPVDGWCWPNIAGSYMAKGFAIQQAGNQGAAADERNKSYVNPSGSVPKSVQEVQIQTAKDAANAGAMIMFGDSPVYTAPQLAAWGSFMRTLYPAPPPPGAAGGTPPQLTPQQVVAQAAARDSRTLVTEPLRRFGFDKAQTIPGTELTNWASQYGVPVPVSTTATVNTDGSLGNPSIQALGGSDTDPNQFLSRDAVYRMVSDVFSSQTYANKLAGRNEAGVLREQIRLESFMFQALLDIRDSLALGNAIKSVELSKAFGQN